MIPQVWSWVLLAVGLVTMWLAGNGRASAWVVGLAGQVLWLTYAVVTGQPGFVVAAVAYAVVYGRNLARALRDRRGTELAATRSYGHRCGCEECRGAW